MESDSGWQVSMFCVFIFYCLNSESLVVFLTNTTNGRIEYEKREDSQLNQRGSCSRWKDHFCLCLWVLRERRSVPGYRYRNLYQESRRKYFQLFVVRKHFFLKSPLPLYDTVSKGGIVRIKTLGAKLDYRFNGMGAKGQLPHRKEIITRERSEMRDTALFLTGMPMTYCSPLTYPTSEEEA